MRIIKKILVLLTALTLMGCSQKVIYQVDGQPLPNNVLQSNVLALNLKVKYNFVHYFKVAEDDEYFLSQEYLSFFNDDKPHVIKDLSKLCININVFNPSKKAYSITTTMELAGNRLELAKIYKGDLSRNMMTLRLPSYTNQVVGFYFTMYDENDNLVFQSFKARYRIEGPYNG